MLVFATLVLLSTSAVALDITECKGPLTPSAIGACSDIGPKGCCDGVGRLLYCKNNDVYCIPCASKFPACGWSGAAGYDCGTAGKPDPTGKAPMACGGCPAECAVDAPCDATCTGLCGHCDKAGDVCLDDGTCHTPACAGKQCGTDPAGISCGSCDAGLICLPGPYQCKAPPKSCQPSDKPGCPGCPCEKCVCNKHPQCCSGKWDAFCAAACQDECGGSCDICPAKPDCSGIGCGTFCGVDCGTCAKGKVCVGHQCCTPQCAGKNCGGDGCGGSCGSCTGSDHCAGGKCVACKPDCTGKICGNDGCGGSCGKCGDGNVCSLGKCVKGGCGGKCGKFNDKWPCQCDKQCKKYNDCCADICQACPDSDNCCKPECANKQCGADGCGGTCGTCKAGTKCADGVCGACTADCKNKQCGSDGCGGVCGLCKLGWTCTGDQCEACAPQCAGKQCGEDGCGGLCGTCASGWICKQNKCWEKADCKPQCEGRVCGDDACGGNCGDCPAGRFCDATGQCGVCTPNCSGDPCGTDGCGGTCMACKGGKFCVEGACACIPGSLPICCGEHVCQANSCGEAGPQLETCGWGCKDNQCTACPVDCDGKTCGDDGCGGTCGTCDDDVPCEAGQCVVPKPPATAEPPAGDSEGCGAGPTGSPLGALLLLGTVCLLACWRRRQSALAVLLIAGLMAGCGGDEEPAPTPDAALSDGGGDVQLDDVSPTDGAVDGSVGPVDVGTNLDSGPSIKDVGAAPDAGVDAAGDVAAGDAAAADVDLPDPLTWDCNNLDDGPFTLEKIPGAIASEDLAFHSSGALIGSNNKALFKTMAGGKAKIWVPGVNTRSGMRLLPNGTLAVCDDKLGRILLFTPDGEEKVLVQGLKYPNGITVDLKGFIYVTEHDADRVLRIHPYSGKYTVLTKEITKPNGVHFDPTYSRLYIGSFGSGWLYTLALSPDGYPGKLSKWATVPGWKGLLDGIGVDICGNVYVCEYGDSDLWRFPPEGGEGVKIIDGGKGVYIPNLQWGIGMGWDPLSIYLPDGWKHTLYRVKLGVPGMKVPHP